MSMPDPRPVRFGTAIDRCRALGLRWRGVGLLSSGQDTSGVREGMRGAAARGIGSVCQGCSEREPWQKPRSRFLGCAARPPVAVRQSGRQAATIVWHHQATCQGSRRAGRDIGHARGPPPIAHRPRAAAAASGFVPRPELTLPHEQAEAAEARCRCHSLTRSLPLTAAAAASHTRLPATRPRCLTRLLARSWPRRPPSRTS